MTRRLVLVLAATLVLVTGAVACDSAGGGWLMPDLGSPGGTALDSAGGGW